MRKERAAADTTRPGARTGWRLTHLRWLALTTALPAALLFCADANAQQSSTIWERIASGIDDVDDLRLIQAQALLAEQNFQQAATLLAELLQERQDSVVTAALLARSYIGLAQYDDALRVCETALSAAPAASEPLLFFQSYALAFLGRTNEAAAVLTEVTQFRTELRDLHIYLSNLAELRLLQGDLRGAQTLWQQALTRSSSYVPALVGYVYTLVGTGRSSEAAATVRRELFHEPELLMHLEATSEWLATGVDLPFRILATRSGVVDERGVDGMLNELRSTHAGELILSSLDDLRAAATAPSPVQRIDRAPCPFHTLSRSQDGSRWAGVCNAGGLRLGQRNENGSISWRPRRTQANGANSTLEPDARISADGQTVTLLYSPVRVHTLPFGAGQTDTPTALPVDDTVQALYQASNCLFSPRGSHFACYANTAYAGDEVVVIDTADMTIADRGYFSVPNGVARVSDDGAVLLGNSEAEIVRGVSGNLYATRVLSLDSWLEWNQILPMALSADGSMLVYWKSSQLILVDMQTFTPVDQWRLEATAVSVTATAFNTFLIATNEGLYEWDPTTPE